MHAWALRCTVMTTTGTSDGWSERCEREERFWQPRQRPSSCRGRPSLRPSHPSPSSSCSTPRADRRSHRCARTISTTSRRRPGIKIVDTSPVDFGKLRAMVESGNVIWNITEIGGQDGYRVTQMGAGRADRCQDRRPQQVPAAGADEPRVLAQLLLDGDLPIARTHFRTARPKSWADFWDVKAFPGPRSLRNHPVDNLEAALMADGVAPDKLYPHRCRSRLQEARRRSTSTSMSGGPRDSSRPSCSSTRRWCWRRGGTDASTTSSARRRRSPWSGTAAS